MKALYSQKLEIRCIKTLCHPKIPEKARIRLLGKLDADFFHYPPCKQAYARIRSIFRSRSELIDFNDLVEDLMLETDFREILENTNIVHCQSTAQIRKMLDVMDKYRKVRIIYEAGKGSLDALQGDKVDVEGILDNMTSSLSKARAKVDAQQEMIHMGKEWNTKDLVQKILFSDEDTVLKTGFREYDTRNGGLPTEGVFIIAATTSGGKSLMLLNLLKQIHLINRVSVCKVSLEMGIEQEMKRFMSNLTEVPFRKFRFKELTGNDKRLIEKQMDRFNQWGVDHDCRHSILCPSAPMSMDDVLITMKPYQFKVLAIDYISLLAGVDVDNQWRVLGSITAQAKQFSRENHCLIILLAQLDDQSEKIRYARAIRENADVYWYWTYTKTEDTTANPTVKIKVGKDRDAEQFEFELEPRFDVMKFKNLPPTDSKVSSSDVPMNKKATANEDAKPGKKSKKSGEDTYTDEIDDSVDEELLGYSVS